MEKRKNLEAAVMATWKVQPGILSYKSRMPPLKTTISIMGFSKTVLFMLLLLGAPVQAGPICTALCTTVVGLGLVAATPAALSAAGFTSGGVAAGSLAASWMSTLGGTVASGSLFATLQSAGAAGVAWSTNILTGSSALAPCAAVCAVAP